MFRNDKLNSIEFLVSKALIDLYISHDELVSANNVLRESNEIKEQQQQQKFCIIYHIKTMETYCFSCKRNTVK